VKLKSPLETKETLNPNTEAEGIENIKQKRKTPNAAQAAEGESSEIMLSASNEGRPFCGLCA